jgi:UDP-N-acetyl-D-glucosamine dehydrogenase
MCAYDYSMTHTDEATRSAGGQSRRLVVVGQGYVGLPLSMRAVEVGYDVVGVEADPARAKRLESGESYVEDIASSRLSAALATGRYLPTTEYAAGAGFDVAVVTVPTPLRDGNPDMSYIQDAGRSLAPLITRGATVVLESTTYPGTTEQLLAPLLEAGSGLRAGADFCLGYSPERIDPGNPVWQLLNTPKVVSGIDAASLAGVRAFYDDIVDTTVPVSTPREAELTKLLENTFRHVNIALVNELAIFAHELGIDVWEAIDAASTKPFGYLRFTPGPGVGGHCLPIDPSYLSWRVKRQLGRSFRFVELANDVNEHMPDHVVQRVVLALNRERKALNGARVLLLGLAYKRNTSDARESPAVRVAQLLSALGADVRVADSHVDLDVVRLHAPLGACKVDMTQEEVDAADLVILLVEHDDFDLSLLHSAHVLDTRHVLQPREGVEVL